MIFFQYAMSKYAMSKCSRVVVVFAIAILSIVIGANLATAVVYTNVTSTAGINHVQNQGFAPGALYMTGGAAAGDFDNDGLIDLFFTRLDAPDVLYRNLGNGTFQDVSTAAGFTANLPTNGAAWGDIDNDGDLDLYLTASGDNRFYMYVNNGSGQFTEQAVTRGADVGGVSRFGQSVTFGDYDGDGYLDIHTNDWGNETTVSTSRLLRNLGSANPGHFEDVTAAAGIDVYRPSQFFSGGTDTKTYRFSSTFSDLDRDGRPDLVIAGDFTTSQVFWNNGDGTFTDGTAAAGVGTDQDGMGSTIGDFDGDGRLDWFISALVDVPGEIEDHSGNRLFRNNGDRTFTDQTDLGGVRDSGWSWGTTFLDHDNDRDLDLFITNGWESTFGDQTRIFQNDDAVFTDISNAAGVLDTDQGRGLLNFDFDQDGDLDVVVINHGAAPILYRNDGGNDNDWLRIKTEGTLSNRDGIGAKITLDPDINVTGDEMFREIRAGSNYLSQSEFTAHFGLGPNSDTIDLITVVWPSGIVQELSDVAANQLLSLVESGTPGDFDQDGDVDADDLIQWQGDFGGAGSDADGDGDSDGADFLAWQRNFLGISDPISSSTTVPEPSTLVSLIGTIIVILSSNARQKETSRSRLH